MRRVVVCGNSGGGKTTLAIEMSRRLGLPVIHLDQHFWRPGWVPTPGDEWREVHRGLVAGDAWIIDGSYAGTMEQRLTRADAAVHVDLTRTTCLLAVLWRSIRNHGRTRPDLTPGCPEHLPDREFVEFIWNFPRASGARIRELLAAFAARGGRVARLRSRREIRLFLAIDEPGRRGGV